MAHEHAKKLLDAEEGNSLGLINMFIGGMLLVCSWATLFIFPHERGIDENFYYKLLGLISAVMLGTPLILQALRDLWSGHSHMDELAALAVVAAFAMGWYAEAGTIAFIMILTTFIEHRTANQARRHIEELLKLTPTKAQKLTDHGELSVEASSLQPNDTVIVRPGDRVPGDGVVERGTSTVNQAPITGESLPVDKAEGDDVFGGTINMTGALVVRIAKAGAETTLSQVKDLILQAERSRIPALRLLDQYASWYTPVILMIAAIVYYFTGDISAPITMLVVACPCAFILAGPTAMVASISAAMRLGIYIKKVSDLEVARKLTAIIFDKTGTLTTGELSVTKLTPVEGGDGGELLLAAAAVEANSRHPVARAVVAMARKARLELPETTNFIEVAGRGVSAEIDGERVNVGRASWLQEHGVDLSEADASAAEGLSLLYVTRGPRVLGWVGLEDKTRADAGEALDQLKKLGIGKLVMVTGDRWSVARRVASEMHCSDVQAEVLPAQKLEMVSALQAAGHKVAVVGDGVNDAPALAAGDISIAMGAAGSDVAIHSASIALMNNHLDRIPFLIKLSRKTFSVITQNLIFALIYVVVMETLAAKGIIGPVLGVLFHLISSIFVIFNSARLVRAGEDMEVALAAPPVATPTPSDSEPTATPVPVPQAT
jgi:Cd2+/Zn2+-exporting ATPase